MKFRGLYRQKCWSSMLEPPEELEDKSGDCEETEPNDMDDEYFESNNPYHFVELERLRGRRL